jgi:hypothetical protein
VSYDRELQFARGDATRRRDYRDQVIQFMELDDKQLKEIGENGWKSSYGKGLRGYGKPERTRWFDTYVEEANFRAKRYVLLRSCCAEEADRKIEPFITSN